MTSKQHKGGGGALGPKGRGCRAAAAGGRLQGENTKEAAHAKQKSAAKAHEIEQQHHNTIKTTHKQNKQLNDPLDRKMFGPGGRIFEMGRPKISVRWSVAYLNFV